MDRPKNVSVWDGTCLESVRSGFDQNCRPSKPRMKKSQSGAWLETIFFTFSELEL